MVVKHATVTLADVLKAGGRLEATVFNIEARRARELIANCEWQKKPLSGQLGLVNAYHLPRFKRPYVDKSDVPFFQPSQIKELLPKPARYLANSSSVSLAPLQVSHGQILLTCSGTIGECTLVSKQLHGAIFSHDLIRIDVENPKLTGYIYTFLSTQIGQLLMKSGNYGAVIQHIEPAQLENIPVPIASDDIIAEIHEAIVKSFALRDESNALIISAQKKLIAELDLPPLEEIKTKQFRYNADVVNFSVPIGQLNQRIDATSKYTSKP